MNRFSRIRHHVNMEDVKEKHSQKIVAEKINKEKKIKETLIIKEISKKQKSDWRNDLGEGMTSSNAFAVALPAVDGDGDVSVIDPLDASNFSPVKMPSHIGQEGGVGDDGIFDSAFVGTVIRDSGTGSGDDGGFDVGGKYLAFQGTGAPNNNARFACLGAIDATLVDTLTITAIVGNDSNGGETPDLQSECLFVHYKTPTMERAESLELNFNPPYDSQSDGIIIKTPLDGQDGRGVNNGGLNNYSITIPEYARVKDTVFVLYQNFNSGSSFDNYGITDIRFQRKTPSNVFVPLDSPEAISFVRVGTDEGDPKKRKKKVDAQLLASDEYVAKSLAAEFPGTGTRVGDDDPFASAKIGDDVEPSPQTKDQVAQEFTAAKLKTALGKPAAAKVADPEKKLKEILKNVEPDTGIEKTGKDLAVFRSDAENKKTDVAVTQEAKNSVKKSPEISQAILEMSPEKQKEAVEQLYPEKAKEILDSADINVIKLAIEQGISKIIVDQINNTISTPLLNATTPKNAFNEYNKFLGNIAKDPNTPGATYENPKDMSNQITKGDMNDLTKTINSGNYQSIVNSIRATNNKKTQKKLKGELEKMIKDTIKGNFGLDNFLHNNVKVNLDHLLKTGKTKLTKEFKFRTGGSAETIEKATLESDPFLFGLKKIADVLDLKYDTLGDPYTVLDKLSTPTVNIGGKELDPLALPKIPIALAVTFGPALVAKLGLTNVKLHGDSSYDAPGMYYEIDVPGKYSVDKKGVPIQSENPSTFETIKQNVSNFLSFGEEDEDAPQREDYPMGRDGAKKFSDDMEEYKKSLDTTIKTFDRVSSTTTKTPDTSEPEFGYEPSNDLNIRANEIIGKSMGNFDNVSAEDLDFLIQNGYPVDDIFFGGQTQSPISELILFGLSAAAIKLALPLLQKAGGSMLSLVKSEWGMRALTDAAYKTFETTGKMPPWYHWAAYKLLPQPVLNAYAKLLGLKSIPQSILYTKATPAGDIGMKVAQTGAIGLSAAAIAKITELMLQGRNKEADKIVVEEMLKITNNNIDSMSDNTFNDMFFEMSDEVFNDYEKWFINSPKVPQSFRDNLDQINEWAEEYDTLVEERDSLDENDPGYSQAYEAYNKNVDIITDEMFKYSPYSEDGYRNNPELDPRTLIPDPKDHEWPEFWTEDPAVVKANDAYREALQKSIEHSKNVTQPALDAYLSYANTLPKKGNMYVDLTKEQFIQLGRLERKAKEALEKSDAIDREQELEERNVKKVNAEASAIYDKKLREYKKVEADLQARRQKLEDEYEEKYNYYNKAYKQLTYVTAGQTPYSNKLRKNGEDYTPIPLYGESAGKTVQGWKSLGLKSLEQYDEEIEDLDQKMIELDDKMDWVSIDKEFLKERNGDIMDQVVKSGKSESFKGRDYNPTKPEPSNRRADASKKRREKEKLGSAGDYVGGDATAAATAAASQKDDDDLLASAGYSIEDKKNVINLQKKLQNNPGYQPKPYELESLQRQMRAQQNQGSMVAHFEPRGKNLFERLSKLRKPNQFFNPNDIKPVFPENPPEQLDPTTGMHPRYGKQSKRYRKLDPMSANAMPPTGDPETDAIVDQQRTKERPSQRKQKYIKTMNKIKNIVREDFTNITTGNKVGQTFRHIASGQTISTGGALGGIESVPTFVELLGDAVPGPDASLYALQGYAKPLGNVLKRKETEDTNKKLKSSQEFLQKIDADVMMDARVSPTTNNDAKYMEDLKNIVSKYKEKETQMIYKHLGHIGSYDNEKKGPQYGELAREVAERGIGVTDYYLKALKKYEGEQLKYIGKLKKEYGDKDQREEWQKKELRRQREKLNHMRQDYIDIQKAIPEIKNAMKALASQRKAESDQLEKNREMGGDKTSLLDKVASKMEVGTAKNVFDLHLNYLKNPTGKVQDINNLISKKDINALSKTITNNATIDQLKFDMGALYGVLQNTIDQNSGLRNSLGNLDQSKIYLNDSQTEVVIEKPYDFSGLKDLQGAGDVKTKVGAPAYAALNVLQGKMSVKDFFKGTDTMMIRVNIPIKKKKKKELSLDQPIIRDTKLAGDFGRQERQERVKEYLKRVKNKAEEDANFEVYTKAAGIKNYKSLSPMMQLMLRDNMRHDIEDGTFNPKEKTFKLMKIKRIKS